LQKGDFIRINYVEKASLTGRVTDTNIEAEAKSAGIFDSERPNKYRPLPVIVGSGMPNRGIDDELGEMADGESRDFEVAPEKAYGTRDPKLINLVPLSFFKKQGINPVRGLPVRTRRGIAIVRSAMGGRIRLDYNHPLAGQNMSYHLEVIGRAEDPETKLRWLIEMTLPGIDSDSHIIEVRDGIAAVELNRGDLRPETVERLREILTKQVEDNIPEIISVKFGPIETEEPAEEEEPAEVNEVVEDEQGPEC